MDRRTLGGILFGAAAVVIIAAPIIVGTSPTDRPETWTSPMVLGVLAAGGTLLVVGLCLLLISPKRVERVEDARYGIGDVWIDVTALLNSEIVNGRLTHVVGNTTTASGHSDPVPNVQKELRIRYRLTNGSSVERVYSEGSTVDIP